MAFLRIIAALFLMLCSWGCRAEICWIVKVTKAPEGVNVYLHDEASLHVNVNKVSMYFDKGALFSKDGKKISNSLYLPFGGTAFLRQMAHDTCELEARIENEHSGIFAQARNNTHGLPPMAIAHFINAEE